MKTEPNGVLYSPQLLSLAVELADYPFDLNAPFAGEARSRSCGSSIALSCSAGLDELGLRTSACAVGQAAAAIFARHCKGKSEEQISSALSQIEAWLAGEEAMPDWPDLHLIKPAREFPGRHGAIVLPWRAALDALSKAGQSR